MKYRHSILMLLAFLSFALSSCSKVEPPKAVRPLPSKNQLAWHELEYYAFIHFNMNTFTNMEWGSGAEKPLMFNPKELDTRQWAKVVKEAGMKAIIITAKHHDGFCLWPTMTTEHSIKNSPYKNGKGDIIKELSEACKEFGLKFGVYLSPWDRNHADYGRPGYLKDFQAQLRELLSNYGDIFEVWFDGANGGSGYYGGANETRKIDNKTYYQWEKAIAIIRELQPNAVIFGDGGPGVRWVGNEEGWANETNWSIIRKNEVYPGWPKYKQLRSGHEDGTHWVPAEADVSIRPGWYYHQSEDHQVKTLPHLLDIYYQSVGRNASLLLNLPVDDRGLVHEADVKQLIALKTQLTKDFEVNLAKGQKITVSDIRGKNSVYAAENITSGNDKLTLMIGVDTQAYHGFVNCGAGGAITGVGNALPKEVLQMVGLCERAAAGDAKARAYALELTEAMNVLSTFDEGPDLVLYYKHLMVLEGHDAYKYQIYADDQLSSAQKAHLESQHALFRNWWSAWDGKGY